MRTLGKMLCESDERVPFVTTLLFAIHPVHTEAVAGIVGRADVMCAFFYLLAIQAYLRLIELNECNENRKFILCASMVFALALAATLCKELGVTVLVRSRNESEALRVTDV